MGADTPAARAHDGDAGSDADERDADVEIAGDAKAPGPDGLQRYAARARELGGSEVGLALRVRPRRGDMVASVVVVTPTGVHRRRRVVFLDGANGRTRSALAAAAVLLEVLRSD